MTFQEEAKLLAFYVEQRSHLKAILICALDTRMRSGEMFKMCWREADTKVGEIYIPKENTKIDAERNVGMTPRLKAELEKFWKVSPNKNRVVKFDWNLESVLKMQKAYLDVQEKVSNDIAVADDVRDKMALNQFLPGVMDGAVEDVKGSYNAIRHPLETLHGIRCAVSILSQLTAQDVRNIAAELGSKAANATLGEAALGKTKADAEFLARIEKLAERTDELANLGKAKVAEAFSDEAAVVIKML